MLTSYFALITAAPAKPATGVPSYPYMPARVAAPSYPYVPAPQPHNFTWSLAHKHGGVTPCTVWRDLKTTCRYCDPPDGSAGKTWARNLTQLLGPRCGSMVPSTSCCFEPLGYDGGPAFGTPCGQVCAEQAGNRVGSDGAYCGRSDRSNYGNCFCGPKIQNAPLSQTLQAIVSEQASFWNVSISFAIHNATTEIAAAYGTNTFGSRPRQLTLHDRIPMGSTTKMYTAVSVLRLAEAGRLHVDDPVAPHIDTYLATQAPCSQEKAWCASHCVPTAHCLASPAASGCSSSAWTGDLGANCSYCIQTLHCHCDGTACPSAATLKMIWQGDARIESVTFKQLIGMTSGLQDYYQDKTNWLYRTVMTGRDVEPLEYLMHMNKAFLFTPGTANRGAYSTNGFSLVGLALAGLAAQSDWADVDQVSYAWGVHKPHDDATLFPTRGACSSFPNMAKQWASESEGTPYHDLSGLSCLNSWLGGNIAARPLDVARFVYSVFSEDAPTPLINSASRASMQTLHELTDAFAAGFLAYGLGVEALWNGGTPGPIPICSGKLGPVSSWGHDGLDYGSGGTNRYVPELDLGISFALTAGQNFGSQTSGMACDVSYTNLAKASSYALNALMNAVTEDAGLGTRCPEDTITPPPEGDCVDAPHWGKISGTETSCSSILTISSVESSQSIGALCDNWFGQYTVKMLRDTWAPTYHITYTPPDGVDLSTLAVDLCRGTCMDHGGGPCWARSKQDSWC